MNWDDLEAQLDEIEYKLEFLFDVLELEEKYEDWKEERSQAYADLSKELTEKIMSRPAIEIESAVK